MKFKTLKELRHKITIKYTMLFDTIVKHTTKDIDTENRLRKAFLDTCIAKENLNQLYGWYIHFSKVYKNYIEDWEDCKDGDDYMKEEDVIEELEFMYNNFYVTPELANYIDTIVETEKAIDETFFGFIGEPNFSINKDGKVLETTREELNVIELQREERLLNLKYSISEWEDFYKKEFKRLIDKKDFSKSIIEQFLSL